MDDPFDEFTLVLTSFLGSVEFKWTFSPVIHDRAVKMDNGWVVKIGRGFDIYQPPDNWFTIGSQDLSQRPCLETTVDVYRES